MSWVRVPPEAAHFFLGKVTTLGVLCCFALFVCLALLASFFLPSHLSLKTCIIIRIVSGAYEGQRPILHIVQYHVVVEPCYRL